MTAPDSPAPWGNAAVLTPEQRRAIRPRLLWYPLGAGLVGLAVVAFAALTPRFLADIRRPLTPLRGDGATTVTLETAGTYYLLATESDSAAQPGLVPCDVMRRSDGLPLSVRSRDGSSLVLRRAGQRYQALASFEAQPGVHSVTCRLGATTSLALALDPSTHRAEAGAGALLGLLLGAAGLTTVSVTAVRRRRAEPRLVGDNARPNAA